MFARSSLPGNFQRAGRERSSSSAPILLPVTDARGGSPLKRRPFAPDPHFLLILNGQGANAVRPLPFTFLYFFFQLTYYFAIKNNHPPQAVSQLVPPALPEQLLFPVFSSPCTTSLPPPISPLAPHPPSFSKTCLPKKH